MNEWRICPRCNNPCRLVPISPMFDETGEKYGLQFFCPDCNWYDPNRFYSRGDFEENENQQGSMYIETTTTTTTNVMENGIVRGAVHTAWCRDSIAQCSFFGG